MVFDVEDEVDLDCICVVICYVKVYNVKVILIIEDVSFGLFYSLLCEGGDEFLFYFLFEGELLLVIDRINYFGEIFVFVELIIIYVVINDRFGVVILVIGMVGGVGVLIFVVNLVWELVYVEKDNVLSVVLLDLGL